MLDTIQNIDFAILPWIHNNLQCNFLDFIMPKITVLGSSGAIWIVVAIVFLISKKYRKYGIILSIGLIMSLLIGNLLLKPLIARPRPCWIESNFPLLVSNPTDYSFLSGHTLASTISAVIITYAD